jgi:cellobiose phosphorylase
MVLEPGARVQLAFVTTASDSRERVMEAVEKYSDLRTCERAFEMAWNNAQLELYRFRLEPGQGQVFQQLASAMVYPHAQLRATERRLRANALPQSRLWAYGISGDLPIIVITIGNARDIRTVREAIQAQIYWRARGLKTDLVILNEEAVGYEQPLSEELRRIVQTYGEYSPMDAPGGIFLRAAGQIPEEDLNLIFTVARVVLVASRGSLAQQMGAALASVRQTPRLVTSQRFGEEPSAPLPFLDLPYFNGFGGFTTDGREYAIYLGPGTHTPAPWINAIANEKFGAIVSESGQGFSWSDNSQANRLTPWNNDPVSDTASEAIYIRDEDTGTFWTPTPLPVRELDAYRARHGQGYSLWEHNSHAIEQELITFVPVEASADGYQLSTHNGDSPSSSQPFITENHPPVRVQKLRLRNASSRRRKLSVTFYLEWILGTTKEETGPHIVTQWDSTNNVMLARNGYHPDFARRVSFVATSSAVRSYTADRTEFMGRNGHPSRPAAMTRQTLGSSTGAALDACAAMQVLVEFEPGQETEIIFVIGQAEDAAQAVHLARQYRDLENAETALQATRRFWDETLNHVQVETPDMAVNFLMNRWLVYQVLSCRVWGRSALYQSGGAYGFRDQLQDVMALLHHAPAEAREHILRAAQHQFVEGDVQHWWHPPSGAGVRTRFSDDLLWLPLVVAQYVRITGDASVLDEVVPFIEGKVLDEHEHEIYMQPHTSTQTATILEHCRRAIEKGLTSGAHGLPLIGIGDWNDGMSRVGVEGRGESVWLAWFICQVLQDFAQLLELREENSEAIKCREAAARLAQTVEEQAWDGDWYRRAYFDDGRPLGSKENEEAKIDSLAQTWNILSGLGNKERAEQAMQAVDEHLIREEDRLILLFTPPFDKSDQDPGYIKGYVPGVRENGGQYTHAAIWVAQAFARKGNGDRAVQLLRMLNPVEHARTTEEALLYKVEPYVVCADVYALENRVGQGGWTWYTGSASWMYRVWLEDVLGVQRRGNKLFIRPCVPRDWPEYSIHYRFGNSTYHIRVENPDGGKAIVYLEVDGEVLQPDSAIPLHDNDSEHHVLLRMGQGEFAALLK